MCPPQQLLIRTASLKKRRWIRSSIRVSVSYLYSRDNEISVDPKDHVDLKQPILQRRSVATNLWHMHFCILSF